MKNRTFFATFLLFLLALYSGIFLLSLFALRDTTRQAKDRCTSEQYFIASALYSDIEALESRGIDLAADPQSWMSPYLFLAGNRGAKLFIYQDGKPLFPTDSPSRPLPAQGTGEERTVSITRQGSQYLCGVSGALPAPFEQITVVYQADITEQIRQWESRNRAMLLAGGIISLLLALLLLLLLGRLFRPFSLITRLSREIAAGDYAVRLPETGRDELTEMARSFNHMAGEIEHKITELAAAAENRQRFVDNFAHELRTPLTAIYGYAQYMQNTPLSVEDTQFALRAILSESRRMQAMANGLMELSNLRSGEISLRAFSLPALFNAVKLALAQKLEEKDVQLFVSCRMEEIVGDEVLLQSLLINLIDNAIKASDPHATICLEAFCQDGAPVITVTDQGRGMAQAELARIMEPYYRVDPSRSRKEGGAGLGLAICRQIADRHGGTITFESAPGRGTQAIFRLPSSSLAPPA